MKRLLTLLALVLCSCAETFVGEEIARPNNESLPDLAAAFADKEATRTYIEEGKYLRWNEDDRLTIFYGNTLNRQYKFNGATGDNSGTFSLVPDGMLGTGNAFDHIYALYPYNADARITDEGVISLTIPAVQNYAENSFGRVANTMIAVTENLEDTFLAFKNACGYLKLKLYNAEGATIKSIEVKGNSGERLAGAATATISFGEAPALTLLDDATTLVTLDCGEGVALGTTAETATEFWVVLPETTFTNGITITATDVDGGTFEKSTSNEVIIERNAIQPMAALEAEFEQFIYKPANNEIWYTNGSTTEATTPCETNVFGANIVSNTYDAVKECWIIKLDGKVTTIGDDAFRNCDSLTSVTIGDSVTTIGDYAFCYCRSLTSVTIGDSVTTIGDYAFYDCESLTSVTIGDSVTTIGNNAFQYCSSLTSVTIPVSVTTIGEAAFNWCESLTSVYCKPTTPPARGTYMFGGNASGRKIYVPTESVEAYKSASGWNEYADAIVGYDFENGAAGTPKPTNNEIWYTNGSTTEATTPYNTNAFGATIVSNTYDTAKECWVIKFDGKVTTIEDWAFANCSSLTSVTIPDSVTTIGYQAFYGCRSLTGVTIGDSVTTIEDYAFYSCSLTSITIPDSVTTIGDGAFYSCESLTSVTIPDSVTTIGFQAFYGCSSLTSVTIPDSVTMIGESAFYYCRSLTSVTIPDSVTTIGDSAFYGCNKLTSVTIPDSVTEIGYHAFSLCSSLTSVTIGNSVTTIGNRAFEYCSSLTSVYCKATTPPALGGTSVFDSNGSGRKIYVSMESVEAYKSASYWKEYKSYIVGYDF